MQNLAAVYRNMAQYKKAEPLFQRALAVTEKSAGPDHPNTAWIVNNLGTVYQLMGQYSTAETYLQRALKIR